MPAGPDRGRSFILPEQVIEQSFNIGMDYYKLELMIDSRMGYDLLWARALKCSCRATGATGQTDQPDPTCTICRGDGWRYVHPYPENYPEYCAADGAVSDYQGMPIRGLVQGMSMNYQQDQAGLWAQASAEVTVKGDIRLGHYDRIIMEDTEVLFDQTLLRQRDATVTIGRNTNTQLRYPIVEVHALHTETARYRIRTDFTIDGSGQLVWVTGRGPAIGTIFSIRYTFHPIWIVYGFPLIAAGTRRKKRDTGDAEDPYGPLPQTARMVLDFVTP